MGAPGPVDVLVLLGNSFSVWSRGKGASARKSSETNEESQSMGKLEPEGGKEGMFAPPLTSSLLGHFAISSPAERRLDWAEKAFSQSRFYGIVIY